MIAQYDTHDEEFIPGVIKDIESEFPDYMLQPWRLIEILKLFDCSKITILSEEYIDKQHRDSYYSYFSQKYSSYERNCIRLAFFDGAISLDDFMDDSFKLDDKIIGTTVLRPLNMGNIGNTLLSPNKLKSKGFFRTCKFKITVLGRRFCIDAFPFSSQDGETMSCAETVLYNLIQYYSQKYDEYRKVMPSDILQDLERESYERVLPSMGVYGDSIAKVLSVSHFYPRVYAYQPAFDEILHTYVESGIPFILGLPQHVVLCIGHGCQSNCKNKEWLKQFVKTQRFVDEEYAYLATSDIYQEYVLMDDNKAPYYLTTVDSIITEYYNKFQKDKEMPREFDRQKEGEKESKSLETIKNDTVSLIVPLHRRIFIDAARALNIFKHVFLGNPEFVKKLQVAYEDSSWGKTDDNPFVWRMFLTTSKKYKDYKRKTIQNRVLKQHYMSWSMPHFIWVLEIGNLDTYVSNSARVEVILDASSSQYSKNCGIISIGYKGSYVYVKDDIFTIAETNCEEDGGMEEPKAAIQPSEYDRLNPINDANQTESPNEQPKEENNFTEKFQEKYLTKLLESVYNNRCRYFGSDFPIYINSNLKGNFDNGNTPH